MSSLLEYDKFSNRDSEFIHAIEIFNRHEWYIAHDLFEAIWHNTNGKERITIQAILQIAVAEVHLSNANFKGATILYGESLGRLKDNVSVNLGLDISQLIKVVEARLITLQQDGNIDDISLPKLIWSNL